MTTNFATNINDKISLYKDRMVRFAAGFTSDNLHSPAWALEEADTAFRDAARLSVWGAVKCAWEKQEHTTDEERFRAVRELVGGELSTALNRGRVLCSSASYALIREEKLFAWNEVRRALGE